MKRSDWTLSIVEAIIWFFFLYYLLFSIKNEVNLWMSAFILLVLAYVGTITCPWFRNTAAYKKLMR
ncbi:hypothetical protein KY313_02030 [Candidatus Woesearchaeota archaeon]|jgi:hypothetical protein|nr:hypothetical protein [Candidatus Woesearchaeota archaeon]